MTTITPIGSLECQRDSFKQSSTATVVHVAAQPDERGLFAVKFSDTVLFPEGGGQPSDTGTLNRSIRVLDVQRQGLEAVHYVQLPEGKEQLRVGDTVTMQVDWPRRFDFMQQHTGAHLVYAVAEKEMGWKTHAWGLSADAAYIDLIPDDAVIQEKKSVKGKKIWSMPGSVRRAIRVHDQRDLPDDARADIDRLTAQSLPSELAAAAGDTMAVRIVEIEGIDYIPCCGTNLLNTAQLQAMKILKQAPARGTNVRVHFAFGGRVLAAMQTTLDRERLLTPLLNCAPTGYVDAATKLLKDARDANQQIRALNAEIAQGVAAKLLSGPGSSFGHLHRETGDLGFLLAVEQSLSDAPSDATFLLLAGVRPAAVLVSGRQDLVAGAVDILKSALPGLKGGGGKAKPGDTSRVRWQGKVDQLPSDLSAVYKQCQQLLG
ncbi:hypothetical protein RI367_006170 [Sorochytrium milnesiophthora]